MDKKRGGRDMPGRPWKENSAGGSRSLFRAFRRIFHLGIDGGENHSAEEHHGGDHKSQLGIDGIEETGGQRADDAAQGLGGVVKAHDQVTVLAVLGTLCHHILQQGDGYGVEGIEQNAHRHKGHHGIGEHHAQAGESAGQEHIDHRAAHIGAADQVHADGGVGCQGHKADHAFDQAVVFGGQAKFVFDEVVEDLLSVVWLVFDEVFEVPVVD